MLRNSETEKLICDTLLDLSKDKPCFKIKVTELVNAANISRSSFYVYFDSIYDVVQKIEDDFIDGLTKITRDVSQDLNENTIQVLTSSLYYIKEYLPTFKILSGPNGDPSFQYRLTNMSSEFFNHMLEESSQPVSPTVHLIYEYMAGGRWQLYKWWASHEEISVEEMADLTTRIFHHMTELLQT